MIRSGTNQEGIALLTVLLATALIALLAVGLTTEQRIGLRRTENLFEGDQAMLLARGMEEWGVQLLIKDLQASSSDHLGEDWAVGLLPVPVGEGMVVGRIEDLQGRININNLVKNDQTIDSVTSDRFERLYDLCGMDSAKVDALADWLDSNSTRLPDGAEDDDYLLNEIPYRSGNRTMVSTSELLLVDGITSEGFRCMEESVTVLPVWTKINVNTAGVMVIASIAGITPAAAAEVVRDRPKNGYSTPTDFLSHPRIVGSSVSPGDLELKSDFFQLTGQAVYGGSEVLLYSALARDSGRVRVFSHSIGAY
ncbi:MAG: type II secretion system minor pseudopilin GspK [Proteobacteria bacterium]|nr:type II secretion system minor pseudopilin GspK [Pseudomonadota bacterium]